eukprot:jgi/Chlat1/7238/Chrsp58S09133
MAPSSGNDAQAQHVHAVGTKVWVENRESNEGWLPGEVIRVDKEMLTVKTPAGLVDRTTAECPPQEALKGAGVDDMTTLSYLHEPGVLHNLAMRYGLDEIYTYTGSILIAVNPFRRLPHLYNVHMMEQYKGVPLGELSPHVFAVADAAYRQMFQDKKSQSILVSGESGAGKTETTKLIMQYLAYMGGRADGRAVEQQVLESNPLLEAFGNAKTIRNDNSSRFGKFVEIQFDQKGRISGAAIRTYLLERSRIVQITDPERNYHVFYQLCAGASAEERERYVLAPAEKFHYLNQSTCYELQGVSNAEEFERTKKAMGIVGINIEEQDAVFRIVASVLHLGNIDFAPSADGESSKFKDATAEGHLRTAAYLLQCDPKGLADAMLTRQIVTLEQTFIKPLDVKAAADTRDTLAKTLYSRLFDWLVARINSSIGEDPDSKTMIGVLDIYGFESFKINSFEQFCINLANERLQQHFNQHVFKMEQEEYEREAIDWSYIDFVDNQDVLDLIEKKGLGVISLLDEACMFPKSTHVTFANKLYSSFANHKRFIQPKRSQTAFAINHYAGEVLYDTEFFLEKNKDYVIAEHQQLLGNSQDPFVQALFPPQPADDGKSRSSYRFSSIGNRFKQQLLALMDTLNATEPHYVRCIKPNGVNKPTIFEGANVLQQLRCGGVLEAIRISCAGFPTRREYQDFTDRFGLLAPQVMARRHFLEQKQKDIGSLDDKLVTDMLLKAVHVQTDQYQLGRTKVFLRAGQMAILDKLRLQRLNSAATTIQKFVRRFIVRRKYLKICKSALVIQAHARGLLARLLYKHMRQEMAAIRIQKYTYYRGSVQRRKYLAKRRDAIRLQTHWRGKLAKRQLRKLKMEAREVTGLLSKQAELEQKLADVQWRLDLERRLKTDMEHSKDAEIDKLRGLVSTLREEAEEAKAQLAQERNERVALAAALAKLQEQQMAAPTTPPAALSTVEENKPAVVNLRSLTRSPSDLASRDRYLSRSASDARNVAEAAAVAAALQAENQAVTQKNADLAKTVAELEEALAKARDDHADALVMARAEAAAAAAAAASHVIPKAIAAVKTAPAAAAPSTPRVHAESAPAKHVAGSAAAIAEALSVENMHLQSRLIELEQQRADEAARDIDQHVRRALVAEEELETQKERNVVLEKDIRKLRAALESAKMHTPSTPLSNGDVSIPSRHVDEPAVHAVSASISATFSEASTPQRTLFQVAADDSVRTVDSEATSAPEPSDVSEAEISAAELERQQRELDIKKQKLLADRMAGDQELLLNNLLDEVGFSDGRPVASLIIFKSLLHWRCFEQERTNVFDRIIAMLTAAIERSIDSNDMLAYWLSHTTTLLYLLQKTLRTTASRSAGQGPKKRGSWNLPIFSRTQVSPGQTPTSAQAQAASANSSLSADSPGSLDGIHQVDAKYPALLFKQQLTACVEKIYGMIRDNVKKEVMPMLSACIQAPRAPRAGSRPSARAAALAADRAAGGAASVPQTPTTPATNHWQQMIDSFSRILDILRANHVPPFLMRKLFTQLFSYVNVQLFNSLLLRRECCSFSNGEYVKTGLADLENWIHTAGDEYMGSSWDELKYIRQAVTFLVIHQKPKKSLDEITHDLCPVLSVQQLYRISTMYWDDKYGTETVSKELIHHDCCQVLASMKHSMNEESDSHATSSFLLDDDSSIPFSVDDISRSLPPVNLSEVPIPRSLIELPSFRFLQ